MKGERFVGDSEWRADGDVCEVKGDIGMELTCLWVRKDRETSAR